MGASGAYAATETITPVQDVDVYEYTGLPTSTDETLGVSASDFIGGGHSQKSLIQFDLDDLVGNPTSGDIVSAKLRLWVQAPIAYPFGYDIGGDIFVSFQDSAWTESTATWAAFDPGSPINVLTLTADHDLGDGFSTWTYTYNVWVEVDVTDAVKDWLDNPTSNHGMVLESDESSSLSVVFGATESANPPELVITY